MHQATIQASLIVALTVVLSAQLPLRHKLIGSDKEALGSVITSLPDLDGDNIPDLMVSAPLWDSTNAGLGQGRVLIYSGADLSLLRSHLGLSGEKLGLALCALGDLDADGVGDYAIGAPGLNRVHLYSGLTGALIRYEQGAVNQGFGRVLARLGDLDADGSDELVIGMPFASQLSIGDGRVRVVSGASGLLLRDYHGDSAGDQFGAAVLAIDDLDGDNLPELVIGAPDDDLGAYNSGSCFVISSNSGQVLFQVTGSSAGERLGSSFVALDDVDGGGIRDFAVGAPFAGTQSQGRIAIYSSETGQLLYNLAGNDLSARLGTALAAGDFNGDGAIDLAAAAPYGLGAMLATGFVDLYSGPNFGHRVRYPGAVSFDLFGYSLSALGDLNDDGFDELAIGVLGSDAGGFNAGEFQILSDMGSRNYGVASAGLELRLLPSITPSGIRTMTASGGKPGAIGSIGVSFAPAEFQAFGLQVLINWAPTVFVLEGLFGFDVNGQVSFFVNMRTPWLQGNSLYLQAYDRDFPFGASTGVELRFGL